MRRREGAERQRGKSAYGRMRAAHLAAHPLCAICSVAPATEIDHITPVSQGGDFWDLDNWQGACSPCHKRKSDRERRGRRLPSRRYLPAEELEGELE